MFGKLTTPALYFNQLEREPFVSNKIIKIKKSHRYNYPRPISEPPSPASSRATTPAPSQHASDVEDDDDSHDSEQEAEELAANLTENLKMVKN